jgi:predicted DNA-binding transcriptional regulator YafY
MADSIISEFGHNLVLNYEENRLVIEFETVESEYLYSQILKFGTGIKILEPQTLIDQLCDYFCNYIENKK